MNVRTYMALSFSLLVAFPLQAQSQFPKGGGTVSLDFHDVELRDVTRSIAEITGKNFILDDRVKGKITIISPAPVTVDEAYQAFLSALEIKGGCAVDVGKHTKIVPLRDCLQKPIETEINQEKAFGDQPVTRLIPLKFISANEIRQALNALVSKNGSMVAYGPTNTLIVTDAASNIRRLMKIIENLDKQGFQQTVEMIPLKYATANEVSEKLLNIFEAAKKDTTRRLRRSDDVEAGVEISKILPDERTNSLIVMATREGLGRVLDLVATLDREIKLDIDRGRIHVKHLQHADAQELSGILSALISGSVNTSKKKEKSTTDNRGFSNTPPALPWEEGGTGSTAGATGEESQQRNMAINEGAARDGSLVQASGKMFEGDVRIASDPSTNTLIITASPNDYIALNQVIDQLDVRRPQVFVEGLIMEVNIKKLTDVGLSGVGGAALGESFGGLAATNLGLSPLALGAMSTNQQLAAAAGGPASGLILGALATKNQFKIPGTNIKIPAQGAIFRAFQSSGAFNVLSAPNILTTDNKKAEIMVGRDVPFLNSKHSDSEGKAVTGFSRQKVGIQLSVTPQINEGDEVTLEIEQKIQEVEDPGQQFQDVTTSERSAKTTVVAQNGQTIVIGGLIKDKSEKGVTKVPLLGDIPLLGYLFRQTKVSKEKTNLMIFLTPHVIHDPMDLTRVSVKKNNERQRFNKKEGVGENRALYDYDLDRGLNMAPPPAKATKENQMKKKFDYDKPVDESEPESETDQVTQRLPRRQTPRATTVSSTADESSPRLTKRKSRPVSTGGNPFADVRPPSSMNQ